MASRIIKTAFLIWMTLLSTLAAQYSYQTNAWGGATDIFDYPVGARAMALGGAYVSVADDPFALYWNPGALQRVPNMGLGVYYTNLAAGTSYNYLAYTHPTLFAGTFSVGLLNISTGDIKLRDFDPAVVGTTNYGRTLFLFGYGFNAHPWLSLGATFKVERANLVGYNDDPTAGPPNFAEASYGADGGLVFTPQLPGPYLNNFTVGVTVQNLLQRTIRAIETRETTPRNLRAGLSKKIDVSTLNHLLVAAEIDKNEKTSATLHMGLEYRYHEMVSLRMGLYNDHLTYGVGAKLAGMQFDYSYWNGNDALLGTSHRLSLVLNIGKNRQQRMEEHQQQELQRLEKIETQRLENERRNAISSGMAEGEKLLAKNDLEQAYVAINRILIKYDRTGSDPDLEVTRELFARISKALEEKRTKEEEALRRLQEEEAQIRRNAKAADDHYKRYLAYFTAEEYHDALIEINKALEYAPNSDQFNKLRSDAEKALATKIASLLERAKTLQSAGRPNEAITMLNEARRLSRDNERYKSYIIGQIDQISAGLSRDSMLRQAMEYENNKNWAKAADLYRELSNSEPGNVALRKKYEDAFARANAKDLDMPEDVKAIYNRGVQAAIAGNYQEALRHLEEARKLQPLNRNILRAIDSANDKLKKISGSAGR
ncbi:PorV/PorQ family protein [bacterium]|nr:PorV/PorQ family protein [bacterium]